MAEVSFGEWLKRRRKAEGFTQEQLAEQVSCSTITLRKIEAEERRPSAQIVERLADIFRIPQQERPAFLRFARGDWKFVPVQSVEDSPWHVASNAPASNIPATTTSLIGREKEIAEVRAYLLRPDIRLVTLMGPPGIGKTRLSLEVASASVPDFADGVFFIPLAPLDDSDLVPPTIAQTLGFVDTKNQSPVERLKDSLGEKHVLLILDNFEHLTNGAAPLVSDLLLACPRLKIMITSREALRVPGEWLYSVPTLNIPIPNPLGSFKEEDDLSEFTALTLFAERARAVRADFTLHADNIQTVAAICAQLDGLPLAIELIAARIRLMSPQALLARLNDQFVLHADGMRALPARQKTLHNAIDWSYSLLSSEEQNLFVRLSVFSEGFTLEAAETIFLRTNTDKPISDLIASLLDKSLLQRKLNQRGEARFHMLVTIQQFALDHLRKRNEETQVRSWHFNYFLDLAEQAEKEIHGPDQVDWMDRLEEEHDNFRAALDWCFSNGDTENVLRLFSALNWTWYLRWSHSEARSWLERIRTLPDVALHPKNYGRVLNAAVRREWLTGSLERGRSLLEESKALWLSLGSDGNGGMAESLILAGMLTWHDLDVAASYFAQSFELYQSTREPRGMAFAIFWSGCIAYHKNEDDLALARLEESLHRFRELGDRWGMAKASQRLGELFLRQGIYDQARQYFEQHLRLDEGFKEGTALALLNLGELHRYQHDDEQAKQYYEKSLSVCREYGLKVDAGYNLYALGMLALHQGNYLLAKKYFHDYYIASQGPDDKRPLCDFLNGMGAVAAGANQPERAAKLYGAAQAISEIIDYQLSPFDRSEFDRHIQTALEQLGETRFQELQAVGRAMTMEQAIAYALEINE